MAIAAPKGRQPGLGPGRSNRGAALLLAAVAASVPLRAGPAPVPAAAAGVVVAPAEESGVLDLSKWDFDASGLVRLDPRSWARYTAGDSRLQGDRHATLRLLVALPPAARNQRLAIYTPYLRTSYQLWVDGRLVASNGAMGPSPQGSRQRYGPTVGHFRPAGIGTIEVVLQVANDVRPEGGLRESLVLGLATAIEVAARRHLATDMVLFGGIFIVGLYYLGQWALRRSDRSSLYFAMLCTALLTRVAATGDVPLGQLFPGFPWEWLTKLECAAPAATLAVLAMLLRSLFPHDLTARVVRPVAGIAASCAMVVVATPARWFFRWIALYDATLGTILSVLTAVMVVAVVRGRSRAPAFLASVITGTAVILSDMLPWSAPGTPFGLRRLGLLASVLIQAFALSSRTAEAFRQVESLAAENSRLLGLVRRQVADLLRSKQLVAAAEDVQRREVAESLRGRVQSRLLLAWHQLGECLHLLHAAPVEAAAGIEEVRAIVDDVREQDVRRVSHLLHPTIVRVGLLPAVRSLVDQYQGQCRVETDVDPKVARLDDPADNRIAEPVRLVAYRVIEEALRNAQRHARASSVTIELRAADEEPPSLLVQVRDDGRGFDPRSFETGVGLTVVADRVALVGGQWAIEGRPGMGTSVSARLPLQAPGASGESTPGRAEAAAAGEETRPAPKARRSVT